jgi:hypothetical protein
MPPPIDPIKDWHQLVLRRLLLRYAVAIGEDGQPAKNNNGHLVWEGWFRNLVSEYASTNPKEYQSLKKQTDRIRDAEGKLATGQIAVVLRWLAAYAVNTCLSEADVSLSDSRVCAWFAAVAGKPFNDQEKEQLRVAVFSKTPAVHIGKLIERAYSFVTAASEPTLRAPEFIRDTDQHPIPDLGDFLGRNVELTDCQRRIDRNKVVEVNGISGIGKTRLLLRAINERIADGRIETGGFFYFDCGIPDMKAQNAAEVFLAKLGGFAKKNGCSDADYVTIQSAHHPIAERVAVVVKMLVDRPCLLFIDNFQEALDQSTLPLRRLLTSWSTRISSHLASSSARS